MAGKVSRGCHYCSARVVFVRHAVTGRSMIFDAAPVKRRHSSERLWQFEEGRNGWRAEQTDASHGFQSHHASCTHMADGRRKEATP